jgi:hypothetical protein
VVSPNIGRTVQFRGSQSIVDASELITPRAVEETNAKLFPVGTLIVALYGEGKTRGKVSELRIEAASNQACAGLTFQNYNKGLREYLKKFLLNNYEAMRRLSSGGVQPNLNLGLVKNTTVPLPPLPEQFRIVAEVERHLSVSDEVEAALNANLQRAARLRQSILSRAFAGALTTQDAPVLKQSTATPKKTPNRHFYRAVLSAEIVHQLHSEPTFGHIKHQKVLHLCEYIAQLEEIQGEYHRDAAGPLDNKMIYANDAELKKQQWYIGLTSTGTGSQSPQTSSKSSI